MYYRPQGRVCNNMTRMIIQLAYSIDLTLIRSRQYEKNIDYYTQTEIPTYTTPTIPQIIYTSQTPVIGVDRVDLDGSVNIALPRLRPIVQRLVNVC